MEYFLENVIKGLSSYPKYLQSKYFYDSTGDRLFQKIMASKDYYLTRAEMEILKNKSKQIAREICGKQKTDVVEFGPGDAVKSIHLIKRMVKNKCIGHYFPIDISENIIELLKKKFEKNLPSLKTIGLHGEYFSMLNQTKIHSDNKRLVIILGANIANYTPEGTMYFLRNLESKLASGDRVLIGFDLKKDPQKILAAYNDRQGFTSRFNLNLLSRINRELNGNFKVNQFTHYRTYDPGSGACKSYLISKRKQQVSIGQHKFNFEKDEDIYMEISQKYSLEQISDLADSSGFKQMKVFTDSKNYFADVLWQKP